MSARLMTYFAIDSELTHVYAPPRKPSRKSRFAEFDVVRLVRPARTSDDEPIEVGAVGTVVTVWEDGKAFDVEFTEPAGLSSLTAEDLDAVA